MAWDTCRNCGGKGEFQVGWKPHTPDRWDKREYVPKMEDCSVCLGLGEVKVNNQRQRAANVGTVHAVQQRDCCVVLAIGIAYSVLVVSLVADVLT